MKTHITLLFNHFVQESGSYLEAQSDLTDVVSNHKLLSSSYEGACLVHLYFGYSSSVSSDDVHQFYLSMKLNERYGAENTENMKELHRRLLPRLIISAEADGPLRSRIDLHAVPKKPGILPSTEEVGNIYTFWRGEPNLVLRNQLYTFALSEILKRIAMPFSGNPNWKKLPYCQVLKMSQEDGGISQDQAQIIRFLKDLMAKAINSFKPHDLLNVKFDEDYNATLRGLDEAIKWYNISKMNQAIIYKAKKSTQPESLPSTRNFGIDAGEVFKVVGPMTKDKEGFNQQLQAILYQKVGDFIDISYKGLNSSDIIQLGDVLKGRPSLTKLSVMVNQIGDAGAQILAANTTLILLNMVLNQIGAEGVQAFATNRTLTELYIGNNRIGDAGAQALAANRTLTTLSVNTNQISDAGAKDLAANTTLTMLDVRSNNISEEGLKIINAMLARNQNNARVFLKACRAGQLEVLDQLLKTHQVSPYAVERSYEKFEPQDTDTLHTGLHLAVLNNQIKVADYLVTHYPHLLFFRDKDNQTALMLARRQKNPSMLPIFDGNKLAITTAHFVTEEESKEEIAASGDAAIIPPPLPLRNYSSPKKISHRVVNIQKDKRKFEEWLNAIRTTSTTETSYTYGELNAQDAKELSQALSENTTLIKLYLGCNNIGAEGAQILSKNTMLTTLYIETNNIGDEGAQAFSANTTLTWLNVSRNKIGSKGAQALSKNTTLTTLNVEHNHITPEDEKIIKAMLARNQNNARVFLQACRDGQLEVLDQLLKTQQVSPYAMERSYEDVFGPKVSDSLYTGLHLAVLNNQREVAHYLVENYPHLLRFRDKDNQTALMLAERQNNQAMIAILQGKKLIVSSAPVITEVVVKETAASSTAIIPPRRPARPYPSLATVITAQPEEITLEEKIHDATTHLEASDSRSFNQLVEAIRSQDAKDHLIMNAWGLNDKDIAQLVPALKGYPKFTKLNVSKNNIGDEGAEVLSKNTTLTKLNMSFNEIGAKGAEALSKNTTLIQLNVSCNEIGAEGAEAFWKNTTLIKLYVEDNGIGACGVEGLSNNTTLTTLYVGLNQIGDKGAEALSKNTTLTKLFMGENNIGDKGAEALSKNTTLTTLDVSNNNIGDKGAEALSKNTMLTTLDVRDNNIGAAGAEALSKNTTLTRVDMWHNNIGDKGAEALSKNTTLTSLHVSDNNIGAKGAEALSKNMTLTTLYMRNNEIGAEGEKIIKAMLARNQNNARVFLQACREGQLKVLDQLLRTQQVSPYAMESSYERFYPKAAGSLHTGLHLAVLNKQTEVAHYLVEHYPHLLRFRDKDNQTALMLAESQNNQAMIAILQGKKLIVSPAPVVNEVPVKEIVNQSDATIIPPPLPPRHYRSRASASTTQAKESVLEEKISEAVKASLQENIQGKSSQEVQQLQADAQERAKELDELRALYQQLLQAQLSPKSDSRIFVDTRLQSLQQEIDAHTQRLQAMGEKLSEHDAALLVVQKIQVNFAYYEQFFAAELEKRKSKQTILSSAKLNVYYQTYQSVMNACYMAAMVISTELVELQVQGKKETAAQVVSLLGSFADNLPFGGKIIGYATQITSVLLHHYAEKEHRSKLQRLTKITANPSEWYDYVEATARAIVQAKQKQIEDMEERVITKPSGFKNKAKAYMKTFLTWLSTQPQQNPIEQSAAEDAAVGLEAIMEGNISLNNFTKQLKEIAVAELVTPSQTATASSLLPSFQTTGTPTPIIVAMDKEIKAVRQELKDLKTLNSTSVSSASSSSDLPKLSTVTVFANKDKRAAALASFKQEMSVLNIQESFEIEISAEKLFINVSENGFSVPTDEVFNNMIRIARKVLGDTIIKDFEIPDNTLIIQSATPRHAAQLQEFLREAGLVRNVPVMRI